MSAPDAASAAFIAAFDALPDGAFTAEYDGARYQAVKSAFSGGKAQKLVAHELAGAGYISLNLYRLRAGDLLKPCEMPTSKVTDFVLRLRPI